MDEVKAKEEEEEEGEISSMADPNNTTNDQNVQKSIEETNGNALTEQPTPSAEVCFHLPFQRFVRILTNIGTISTRCPGTNTRRRGFTAASWRRGSSRLDATGYSWDWYVSGLTASGRFTKTEMSQNNVCS